MKKLLFTLIFGAVFTIQAQYEIKLNPVMTALGQADISGEYLISETLGVELSLQPYFGKAYEMSNRINFKGKQSGFGEKIRLKYYYSPYDGGDRYYIDFFITNKTVLVKKMYETFDDVAQERVEYTQTFKDSFTAIGFDYGYKYFFDSGFVFEYALGLGVMISDNSEVINDKNDPDRSIHADDMDSPVIFSGKFSFGYRFGDY